MVPMVPMVTTADCSNLKSVAQMKFALSLAFEGDAVRFSVLGIL